MILGHSLSKTSNYSNVKANEWWTIFLDVIELRAALPGSFILLIVKTEPLFFSALLITLVCYIWFCSDPTNAEGPNKSPFGSSICHWDLCDNCNRQGSWCHTWGCWLGRYVCYVYQCIWFCFWSGEIINIPVSGQR